MHTIYEFLESRCFPRDRVDCKMILEKMGLDTYNVEKILRKNYGAMLRDFPYLIMGDQMLSDTFM